MFLWNVSRLWTDLHGVVYRKTELFIIIGLWEFEVLRIRGDRSQRFEWICCWVKPNRGEVQPDFFTYYSNCSPFIDQAGDNDSLDTALQGEAYNNFVLIGNRWYLSEEQNSAHTRIRVLSYKYMLPDKTLAIILTSNIYFSTLYRLIDNYGRVHCKLDVINQLINGISFLCYAYRSNIL
jgi:hypothetical protein